MPNKAYFQTKIHQMSLGGRAPPVPAGGAYSAHPDPLAVKLLASSALDPRRIRRLTHAFGIRRQSVPVLLFFDSNTGDKHSEIWPKFGT